jgi:hypothetical protein
MGFATRWVVVGVDERALATVAIGEAAAFFFFS